MANPLPTAMVDAAARELYNACSEDNIPWEYCPKARTEAYRVMARRMLLAGLAARPLAGVAR